MRTARELAHEILRSLALGIRCISGAEPCRNNCDYITAAIEARDAEHEAELEVHIKGGQEALQCVVDENNGLRSERDAALAEAARYRGALEEITRPVRFKGLSFDVCRWCQKTECSDLCPTLIARRALTTPSPTTGGAPATRCDHCGKEAPLVQTFGPPINGGFCADCRNDRPPAVPGEAGRCAEWCGKKAFDEAAGSGETVWFPLSAIGKGVDDVQCFCTSACRDAGKPLHPTSHPSDGGREP